MTSYHILQTEVTLNILPYLGYPDLLRSYCRLTKKTLQIFLDYFLCHKDVEEVSGGTLQGDSREKLLQLIHGARKFVFSLGLSGISPQAESAVQRSGDLRILQTSPQLMLDYFRINVNVYTNWEGTASEPQKGIFHYLLENIQESEEAKSFLYKEFIEDCRYWNSSKVFGDFIVLMERRDGSILVSADYNKVYLVLGHVDSLAGKVAFVPGKGFCAKEKSPPPKIHGTISGAKVKTILLNWQNKVVYDGLMAPMEMVTKAALQKAFRAYLKALNTGTLITTLPKNEATAVLVEPYKLDQEEYESYRLKYQLELQSIGSKPSPKGFDINRPTSLKSFGEHYLVFRRFGYTEEENPNHVITVLKGSAWVGTLIMDSIAPTIGEYIKLAENYCNDSAKKPAVIAVDYAPNVEMFKRLMRDVNIHVGYYPPPSDVETFLNDLTNPYMNAPRCKICSKTLAADGTALMQCSQCKNVYYCSKEHQKQDWKSHKKYCIIHK